MPRYLLNSSPGFIVGLSCASDEDSQCLILSKCTMLPWLVI